MLNTYEMQNYITDLASQVIDTANDEFKINLKPIDIDFTLTGRVSGQFCYKRNKYNRIHSELFRFNVIIACENEGTYMRTVVHEASHYVAYSIYGCNIKPHGKEWKHVMRVFGYAPKVTHSYSISEEYIRSQLPYKYECGCRTHNISLRVHNRMQRGRLKECTKCKTLLVWTGMNT